MIFMNQAFTLQLITSNSREEVLIIVPECRKDSKDELFKENEWAHLQPAVALPISRLLKSPEEASRTCGETNVQFKLIQMSKRVD